MGLFIPPHKVLDSNSPSQHCYICHSTFLLELHMPPYYHGSIETLTAGVGCLSHISPPPNDYIIYTAYNCGIRGELYAYLDDYKEWFSSGN